jgi:hypothetical protein
MPELTVSAPGNPLKKLSKERFSCMMTTTCWIAVDAVRGAVTGVAVAAVGVALVLEWHPELHPSMQVANADRTTG